MNLFCFSKEAESIFSRQNSTLSSGIENAGIFGSRFASSEEDCQVEIKNEN